MRNDNSLTDMDEQFDLQQDISHKINRKTKPLQALGQLEEIAYRLAFIQKTLQPKLDNPHIVVFAGDHGIAESSGVSAYPQIVTQQMVLNFLRGGAAINVFCKQHQIELKIIDAGVNADFTESTGLINCKIRKGTNNFLYEPAMTMEEATLCLKKSQQIVDSIFAEGCNVIGFGEMGIGNTSAAALIMSQLCNLPLEQCVGRGTGLDDTQLHQKVKILKAAKAKYQHNYTPLEVMAIFGGFEIAQMSGAMLAAYEKNMVLLIDGFIASAAFLVAYQINPQIIKNSLFCHLSDEYGHQSLLDFLKVRPILKLNLRLGEGTGCALAYPIIQSALLFFNEMSSFEEAGVADKVKI